MWDNSSVNHYDTPNYNSLYQNNTCWFQCDTALNGTVSCGFNLLYYAEPSLEWAVNITAYDGADSGHNVTYFLEMQNLTAVNFTLSIVNFSEGSGSHTLDLDYTTPYDTDVGIQNVGNVEIDIEVSGDDMDCTIGSAIPVGNVRYDGNAGTAYASMCGALTSNGPDTCSELKDDFDLDKTTDGTPLEKSTYWRIHIPSGGVGGLCSGNLYLDAV
jgi:hypothetical protein